MDNKFYVSLDAARLLKEKGYNEMTDCSIDEDGNFWNEQRKNETMPEWKWSCPTKAEAIDWLDNNGIIIEVFQDYRERWFYVIKEIFVGEENDTFFPTRLEAEEAAIIKACEFLENGN